MVTSFPSLLDGIEKYAFQKLKGISLGEIEWYHRLRNELYHQGNGLTIERTQVEVYAEIAKLLFSNLFEFEIYIEQKYLDTGLLRDFLKAWSDLLGLIPNEGFPENVLELLLTQQVIDEATNLRLHAYLETRRNIIFGKKDFRSAISISDIEDFTNIIDSIKQQIKIKPLEPQVRKNDLQALQVELVYLERIQSQTKIEMSKLKARIDQLLNSDSDECPICRHPLEEEHKKLVVNDLQIHGKLLGDEYRSNSRKIEAIHQEIENIVYEISL
jgi:hypothetical protein